MLDSKVYQYALKNDQGDVIALSETGQKYTFLKTATKEDINVSTTLVDAATIDFGENATVTSGKVTITTKTGTSADTLDEISATAEKGIIKLSEGAELKSGEYTVVGRTCLGDYRFRLNGQRRQYCSIVRR